jgi:transcriptional regulator with XRE-family HTH domain
MSEKNKIGARVKLIRENRKLSIEDVSERTNLSVEQISSIEDGSLVPNLTPLIKIARVLGVRLGTFMDDDENLGPVVTRAKQEKAVTRFSDRGNAINSDLDFYTLAQNKAGRHMDPFVIDIFPSSENEIKLSTHEGEEFIYVLEGEVEIKYGKETYQLKAGDSIYYESIVAHHVHSFGSEKAKILAIVYTPA